MPFLIVPLILAALIYGAIGSFHWVSKQFGWGVAVGIASVIALLIGFAVLRWWRRRREVAANLADGYWSHELKGEWGAMRLSAGKRLCNVRIAAAQGAYIFADLQHAAAEQVGESWKLRLEVKDAKQPVWQVPMTGRRQALQWQRIMALAMAQKLGA